VNIFLQSYTYAQNHAREFWLALGQHGLLVAVPLAIGLLLGFPLGVWSAHSRRAASILSTGLNGLRVIPSLVVLFLLVPYTGLSFQSAVIALTLLVLPPIFLATDVGLRSIPEAIQEAAAGMGMSPRQVWWWVKLPLARPLILAGIKTATLEAIASATLAAFIGAGGLGTFITLGFAVYDPAILLVGAIPVAALALLAEVCLRGR
jgi:osmoprotectant transport system permease protein